MIKTFTLSLFLLFLFLIFGEYQYIRYNQFIEFCKHERKSDLLLANGACKDIRLSTIRNECENVEHRLRITPLQCARSKLIDKSELMRLWTIMTESYLGILGVVLVIILPPTFYFISKVITGWFDERRTNHYMAQQAKFVKMFYLNGNVAAPNTRLLSSYSPPRKRKKRERVFTIDDDSDDDSDNNNNINDYKFDYRA